MLKELYFAKTLIILWLSNCMFEGGGRRIGNGKKELLFTHHRPSGITIEVGSENIEESLLPAKGNIVTYDYDHQTKSGIPVNPRVTRLRTDLFWEDVLRDYTSSSTHNSGTLLV
jgi:hypothetical protein